jgi:hypothetical protein
MQRTLLVLCAAALLTLTLYTSPNRYTVKAAAPAAVSSYGLYGVVTYPGSGVVISPVVTIYKSINNTWVYQGTTTASACGYYTYDTGGTGNFKAVVSGYYGLRNSPCGTHFANESVGGFNVAYVSWWNPQTKMDVSTN